MALDSAKLVQHARNAATRGDDLYALLGVDATTPAEDIHRAWKRASLRSHPDRAGIHYDAGKYELLRRARDVLVDVTARFTYDSAFMAAPQKRNNESHLTYDLTASSSTEHGHNTRSGGRGQYPMSSSPLLPHRRDGNSTYGTSSSSPLLDSGLKTPSILKRLLRGILTYLLRGLASLIHILGHGTKAIYKGLKPHTSIIVGFLLFIGTVGLSVMLVYWMVMFVIQGCITAWEWINTGVVNIWHAVCHWFWEVLHWGPRPLGSVASTR
jgi:hypothetical protein